MARQRIATGMKISDIMDMSFRDFEKYTPTQQREIVSRLGSAANKRLKTLQKNEIENPATLRLNLSGGKISVKGKSGEELKQELYRAKQFLSSKFSKTSEWKKFEKKLNEGYKNKQEREQVNMGLAFSYYDLLQEIDPSISRERDKYKLVDVIADYIREGNNSQQIIDKSKQYLENRYKEEQNRYNNQSTRFGDRLDDTPTRYRRKKRKHK